MTKQPSERLKRYSWAMYDWANSAFSTTVIAGLFPIFFKDYWSKGTSATESTFWLGIAVSSSSLIVSVLSPILGALADLGSAKKRLLFFFASVSIVMTGSFFLIGEGQWQLAIFTYALANVGFLSANTFYDSLLVEVSTPKTSDFVSSLGYALGYFGGGLLFLLNIIMIQNPASFGLSGSAQAVQVSFLTVAIWWAVFSIPIFLFVPESKGNNDIAFTEAAKRSFSELRQSFHEIRKLKTILLFLIAYWLYIDGVDTIISMAVDYGKSIGIQNGDLITALLMVQFVAFPFALLFGYLGQKFNTKSMILVGIGAYVLVTFMGANLDLTPVDFLGFQFSKFFGIAFLVGMVQGGVQALSRSFYSRLIPKEKSAEFFGFYNMVGKFAAIIGPVLMGSVSYLTGDPRYGIQSVAILFVIGGGLLIFVKAPSIEPKKEI